MIGTTVGKYRIVDKLGRGGMGTVYKAVDQTLDREVAIKVLNPDLTDADVLKRFRAEAVTLARLNHPGIATIYELHHQQDDELLMVMEFVRGETFHDLSDRLGPLAPPQAAHLCMQVLDALGHAHRGGVVHRDLKPANLMITDGGAVKVMDFGIARVLGTEHFTHGGYMMGTPAYMAPEQVLGREIDGRADLYSVGVVLYRLLTGQLPFKADTAISMVQMQISEPPTPIVTFRPDLPPWCTAIVDRALAKSPSDRFQSAEEFRGALVVGGDAPGARRDADALDADAARTRPRHGHDGAAPHAHVDARLVGNLGRPSVGHQPRPDHFARAASRCDGPPANAVAREDDDRRAWADAPDGARGVADHRRGRHWRAGVRGVSWWPIGSPSDRDRERDGRCSTGCGRGVGPAGGRDAGSDSSSAMPPPAPVAPVPAPPKAPASGTVVGQPPAGGERGVATAGAGPGAAKTAGRGTSTGVSPGGSPVGGRSAAPDAATKSEPAPAAAPPPPPVPAVPAMTFNQVRLLVAEGDRVREREGVLQLGDGQVSIVTPGGGAPIMSLATQLAQRHLLRPLQAAEVARRQRSDRREQDRSRPPGLPERRAQLGHPAHRRGAGDLPHRRLSAQDRPAGAPGTHGADDPEMKGGLTSSAQTSTFASVSDRLPVLARIRSAHHHAGLADRSGFPGSRRTRRSS